MTGLRAALADLDTLLPGRCSITRWGTLAGLAAAPVAPRLAGWTLLTVGVGGSGCLWWRLCEADWRKLPTWRERVTPRQVAGGIASHAPQIMAGFLLVERANRSLVK